LDLLKKYNIKATFFVIGENIHNNQDVLKRIEKEGHVIGVHTFTHPDLTKLSDEKVREELIKTIDAIHKVLPNYKIKFMRPPYGMINEKVKKIIASFGLEPILWSALGDDYLKIATPEYIKKSIDRGLQKYNGGIVLLHDGGGDFENGIPLNNKFRDGKQNVIDYLTAELPNLVEKYTLITIE
jgi:peptidoglycan/xylan/chitin deacetylase (PgdA/CDA1 family)